MEEVHQVEGGAWAVCQQGFPKGDASHEEKSRREHRLDAVPLAQMRTGHRKPHAWTAGRRFRKMPTTGPQRRAPRQAGHYLRSRYGGASRRKMTSVFSRPIVFMATETEDTPPASCAVHGRPYLKCMRPLHWQPRAAPADSQLCIGRSSNEEDSISTSVYVIIPPYIAVVAADYNVSLRVQFVVSECKGEWEGAGYTTSLNHLAELLLDFRV